MNKRLFYLLLIILLSSTCLANSSYKLGIIPEDYSVNKNETLNIILALSGNGNISYAKVLAYGDESLEYISGIEDMSQGKGIDYFIVNINPELFKLDEEVNQVFIDKGIINGIFPLKIENGFKEISIKSNKQGDHKVLFILTYSEDGEKWYSDSLEFNFHVNSLLEQNFWFFGWTWEFFLLVLGLFVALISLILTSYNEWKSLFVYILNKIKIIIVTIFTSINSIIYRFKKIKKE